MDSRDEDQAMGQVVVFTGPGKGKTTTAVGNACRVIARDEKVVFVYFTGPRYPVLGEVKTAATLGSNWRMIGVKSEAKEVSYLDDFTESVDTVQEALALAHNRWLHECDLLVLDDISPHLKPGGIAITRVLALIDGKPLGTSIILTGQSVPEEIMKKADAVRDFLLIKRPSNADIRSRGGFDF